MAHLLRSCLTLAATAGLLWAGTGPSVTQTMQDVPGAQVPSARMPGAQVPPANVCGTRDALVKKLASEFKENQAAVGMLHETAILEVFVSEQGTWTILATGTDGKSCVLAAGQDWETAIHAIGQGA